MCAEVWARSLAIPCQAWVAYIPWNGAILIKISQISLFPPTYFAVAVSHSELKLTHAFATQCMKSSAPMKSYGFEELRLILIKNDQNRAVLIKWFLMQIKWPLKAFFAFPRLYYYIVSYHNPGLWHIITHLIKQDIL